MNGEISCVATQDANLATDSQRPTGPSEAGNGTATEAARAESAGQHAKSRPCDRCRGLRGRRRLGRRGLTAGA